MTPFDRLIHAVDHAGAPLSVGLEPRPGQLPDGFADTTQGITDFLQAVIDNTAHAAAAYKPTLAFFEALGSPGVAILEQLHERIPPHAGRLADATRGASGSPAAADAPAIHERVHAHAVTINPLMGTDAVEPFLEHPSSPLVYILALTSNPGAIDFILEPLAGPAPLAERIATKCAEWDAGMGRVGLVVGATRDEAAMRRVHDAAPDLPWLVPGVGAQGGAVTAVRAARPGARRLDGGVCRLLGWLGSGM